MNDIVKFSPKLPAHLRNVEMSAVTKALVGEGRKSKRISIKGGVFRLIINGEEVGKIEDRFLDVAIVAAAPHIGRTYYEGTYNPDAEAVPPVCWSSDGVAPDESVAEPQATRCITCPQNVKGSGQNNSKACRYSQRIAVALANDIGGDVLQLSLPATSLWGDEQGDERPLQVYSQWLAAQNIQVDMVVTRMKFDTEASNPKLLFKPVRYLDEDEYATVQRQGKTSDAEQAITFTVSQQDGVKQKEKEEARPAKPEAKKPVALPPKKKEKEKAQAAPEPEDEDEPPTKRDKTPPPPPKQKVLDVLDEWDDED